MGGLEADDAFVVEKAEDAERRLLQGVLASVDDGFTVQDAAGKLLFANASAARLTGFSSPEELLRTPADEILARFEMFAEDGSALSPEQLPARAVIAGRVPDALVVEYRVKATDERRWSIVRAYPVAGADGKLVRVINVFQDITDEQRRNIQQRFLLRAMERFNASLDYEDTLKTIAREMVPELADWCAVDILEGDVLKRLAVEHVDPEKVALVREIERRYPPDPTAPSSPRSVIESRQVFLRSDIPPEAIRATAKDAEHVDLIERLGLCSYLVVPMVGGTGPVGALTLATAESRRRYSDSDAAFARVLADRAASAIEKARLVRALEATVRAEKNARAAVQSMQLVTSEMARAKTPSDVAATACQLGGQATGARAAHLWLVQDGGRLSLAGSWAVGSSLVDEFRHISATADTPATRVARTGKAEWIETAEEFARAAPDIYGTVKAKGLASAFGALPVESNGRMVAVLSVAHDLPHVFSEDERAFYTTLALHCGEALERARLFEEAERAAKFSEMFVGIVSHDLRNPLNAILMGAHLVLMTSADDKQRGPAARIVASTQRMRRMVDQLLDFTRIRLGDGLRLERAAIDLGALARQMADEIEAAHDCTIAFEQAGNLAGRWDADRLGQVLSNLLANAATHGARGSPIRLRIDGEAPEGVAITVGNEGEVPAELLGGVFEPFRGRTSATRRGAGLGLGLYITHEIVRGHGGTIEVASREGRTTVRVEVPRAS